MRPKLSIILLLFQPPALQFDAQLRFSVSEASVFCAPVPLAEMQEEPENLFLFGLVARFPKPALTGVLPGKA
ncbi:hypothetical protein [Vibrio spartinae]|uniref:hypothetical protein n=1 Tax=Vibrio spartinae TaxID=1918945 RepID=UPI0011151B58|nr:hypothetical protein [Vibrio spartinae]